MEKKYLLQVCGFMDQGLVGFGTQPLLAVIPGVPCLRAKMKHNKIMQANQAKVSGKSSSWMYIT